MTRQARLSRPSSAMKARRSVCMAGTVASGGAPVMGPEEYLCLFADQIPLPGQHRGLGPVRHVQLAKDVADVLLDRLLADVQARRDARVGVGVRQQTQYLELASRQGGERAQA